MKNWQLDGRGRGWHVPGCAAINWRTVSNIIGKSAKGLQIKEKPKIEKRSEKNLKIFVKFP